jgi:ligand-binding SRPBCC domain-containing protein
VPIMADYVLERRVWLPRPRPEVFAFFADPSHLSRLTAPSGGLRWLTPPPRTLAAGAILDFSTRLLGLPVRWRVFVREFDPPYRFVDAQILGPFARWEHRHRFLEGPPDDGREAVMGTWVEDRVTYRLPLGPLGRLVHTCVAGRKIAGVFDWRERRLRELLGLTGAPVLADDSRRAASP